MALNSDAVHSTRLLSQQAGSVRATSKTRTRVRILCLRRWAEVVGRSSLERVGGTGCDSGGPTMVMSRSVTVLLAPGRPSSRCSL